MKLPVPKPLARFALAIFAGGCLLAAAELEAQSPPPPGAAGPEVSATPAVKPPKTPKPGKADKTLSGDRPASKEIPIPLIPGVPSTMVSIPQNNEMGQLISQLMAAKMTRLPAPNQDCVQVEQMNLDLFHADGSKDFHIIIPTSIFNLKTRIISSENPVTVSTPDFELTGEKMEFDTVERSGTLRGRVRMVIHNLKKTAGASDEESPTK